MLMITRATHCEDEVKVTCYAHDDSELILQCLTV
jgi:hypothetical protein